MGYKVDVDSVVRIKKNRANLYDMVAVTSNWSEEGKKLFEVVRLGGFKGREQEEACYSSIRALGFKG